jgi:hypothetical protein
MALQIRRGSEADRITFIPAQGELLYSTDDKKLYVGDGITPGGNAVGGGDLVTETTAAQFVHNQHTNISFTYNSVSGRIIGSVPGLFVAGDDSTVRTVNLGETIKFSGTGGSSVTSDAEGNITIDSLTYNIEAIPTGGGAKVRLQSALSQDDITFVGAGGTTVTAVDANTIQIDSAGGGSGGINSGTANRLAYYASSGTTLSDTPGLTFDAGTGTLSCSLLDTNTVITDSSTFSIIPITAAPDNKVTFGGVYNSTTYDAQVVILNTQIAGGTTAPLTINSFHSGFLTSGMVFRRANGTLTSPTSMNITESVGAITFSGFDGNDYRQTAIIAGGVDLPPGNGAVPGNIYFLTSDSAGILQTTFFIDSSQNATFTKQVSIGGTLQTQEIEIKGNVIKTFNSNANLELRTSGAGAIYLDNVSINQGIIDTLDSSALQFTPSAVFASDVTVENDLTITNKVYANEFVSTSTSTPEISATTQLLVTVGSQQWDLNADGGLKLPILSSAPGSPVIGMYVADGVGWDPDSKTGSVPYPVYYDGSAFNALY